MSTMLSSSVWIRERVDGCPVCSAKPRAKLKSHNYPEIASNVFLDSDELRIGI